MFQIAVNGVLQDIIKFDWLQQSGEVHAVNITVKDGTVLRAKYTPKNKHFYIHQMLFHPCDEDKPCNKEMGYECSHD